MSNYTVQNIQYPNFPKDKIDYIIDQSILEDIDIHLLHGGIYKNNRSVS